MPASDLFAVLQWWLVLFLLGLGFLPITTLIFEAFCDKGYVFAKLLGLVFLSLAALSFLLCPRKSRFIHTFRRSWGMFVLEELLFLVGLVAWTYIHSFAPDIHGLEKYMDFGFINSILRSSYFPPKDMWLAPFYINYYYFGHIMTAVLTKLSGLPANITFNLMLSTVFAFCLTETFSLGANLYTFLRIAQPLQKVKRAIFGLFTAVLVTCGGNLHVIYSFFKADPGGDPVAPWALPFMPLTFPNGYSFQYATRFISHTIHEFPVYSWLVADLHGHVLDIPLVLLAISLLLSLFMNDPEKRIKKQNAKETYSPVSQIFLKSVHSFEVNPLILILIGFLLALMYMTNAWDAAIYALLTALGLIYLHWRSARAHTPEYRKGKRPAASKSVLQTKLSSHYLPAGRHFTWIRGFSLSLLFALGSAVLFLLPYNYFFKPFVSGVGVLCAPKVLTTIGRLGPLIFETDHCERSLWWELLILYGFFYFFVSVFLMFILKTRRLFQGDLFVLLLINLSTLLIVLPEYIYIKDIYAVHYRANTMFKLAFQAFLMLSLSTSYIILRVLTPAEKGDKDRKAIKYRYRIFLPITLVLVALVMTYPCLAVRTYFTHRKTYRGLDGTKYLQILYPTDYAAIQWINKDIKGQPVILEASGDSYTDYARISANTGLPTVLGWTLHEWLWRGSFDVPADLPPKEREAMRAYYPAQRISEIRAIYETSDLEAAKSLLRKYDVKYVFIGVLEFQKYPNLNEEKFGRLGTSVFQNGTTKIYRIN